MSAEPIGAVTGTPETLPGLDVAIVQAPGSHLAEAARIQLDALQSAGRLGPGNAILVGLIRDLCETIAKASARGQAAGVGMASRQLLDALDKLPPLVDEVEADEWADVLAALGGPAADVA